MERRGAELVLLLLKFAPKEKRRSNDEGAPLRAWSKPVLFLAETAGSEWNLSFCSVHSFLFPYYTDRGQGYE